MTPPTFHKFYRYLRPVVFNTKRHEAEAKVNGGVGFLVSNYEKTDTDFIVTVTVTLCSKETPFSKEFARHVLDHRLAQGYTLTFATDALDAESMARAFVQALDTGLIEYGSDTFEQYFNQELYANEIAIIVQSVRSADTLKRMSREIVEAMGIGNIYRGL